MGKRSNDVEVQLPPVIDEKGRVTTRGTIAMAAAGKPPKLRFRPGMIVKLDGELWEVLYAFRFANDPNVWRYRCEKRQSLAPIEQTDERAAQDAALKRGKDTPRVVKDLFRNHSQREEFFKGIPVYAEQLTFTSQSLLHGHVVKEGGTS